MRVQRELERVQMQLKAQSHIIDIDRHIILNNSLRCPCSQLALTLLLTLHQFPQFLSENLARRVHGHTFDDLDTTSELLGVGHFSLDPLLDFRLQSRLVSCIWT